MNTYSLEIDIRPKPKERPRVYKGRAFTPKKTQEYEELIAFCWKKRYGDTVLKSALKIEMQFLFEKAKSCKKTHHTQRPDIDNLEKAVLDGLNKVAF